jgi:hypothetical protein
MHPAQTKLNYDQAIGEFVVLYAQMDLHITKFIAVHCKLATENNLMLSIPIQSKLESFGKVKKLDNIISDNLIHGNIQLVKEYWDLIKNDVFDLTQIRHHLVHGTGVSVLYNEPMETRIINKSNALEKREFTIDYIKQKSKRPSEIIYHQKFGLVGDFWHLFAMSTGLNPFFLTGIQFTI